MSQNETTMRICRQCHTILKTSTQKYCGNGCERKPPFIINGKKDSNQENREISLPYADKDQIRWMCINCKKEYNFNKIKEKKWVCDCGLKNDFYPFTTKSCGNAQCKIENELHTLPLNAKVCDLCGNKEFLLNNCKNTTDLKSRKEKKKEKWIGLEEIQFSSQKSKTEDQKDIVSLNFNILSNNFEKNIFGTNLDIRIKDMLQYAWGYMPESIYSRYIQEFGYEEAIFKITFNEDTEQYLFRSMLDAEILEMNADLSQKGSVSILEKGKDLWLKENDFLLIKTGFFKIRVWVY
jgi:hypothetical protein